MFPLVLAGIWGGVTVILIALAINYGVRVNEAERRRDTAEEIALVAVQKSQALEADFEKAKKFFENNMNRPLNAVMTDDQAHHIAKLCAAQLLPLTSSLGVKQ